ncbi:MAG TPA: arylesterase [Longimicrobium sp.]|nr:arylesterase [Longimicrobium sp.]
MILGCQAEDRKPALENAQDTAAALNDGSAEDSTGAAASTADRRVVMFVGTSLTAALGLDPSLGFPARVQAKIDSAGLPFEVVNAGVSGEVSRQARDRVARWLVKQPFDVMVLETGANDMLQGRSLQALRENVQAIVDTVRAARPGVTIVLAGMVAAPNLGERYGSEFRAVYTGVAEADSLPLIPFLLDGVAGHQEMNLGDGIHPNERGHRIVAQNVWRVLEPVLREAAAKPSPAAAASPAAP